MQYYLCSRINQPRNAFTPSFLRRQESWWTCTGMLEIPACAGMTDVYSGLLDNYLGGVDNYSGEDNYSGVIIYSLIINNPVARLKPRPWGREGSGEKLL